MVRRAALALLALTGSAHAWVTGEHPVPDYSAYTMAAGEVRLSPFRSGYAFTDWLQVETLPLLYIGRVFNLDAKASYRVSDTWVLSANLGVLSWNLANMPGVESDAAVRLTALPIAARSTWTLGDWALTAGASYTSVKLAGDTAAERADLDATGAVSTGQIVGVVEYRFSRSFALVLEGHLMVWEDVRADGSSSTDIDEDTVLVVYGDTSVDLGESLRGNGTLSAMWSWETFNLRIGGGYGHYSLPAFATFLPTPTIIPEFELYWRF